MNPATGPTHRDGPLAFVDDLAHPVLDPDDHHHLARVLRVRDGEPMVVGDGRGGWRTARFGEIPSDLGEIQIVPVSGVRLTVAFSLIKGDRPELIVEKLTELGIDEIVPFTSDHSVVRWDAKRAARQGERLERIARGASMQCRRTHLPQIAPLTTFAELARSRPAALLADADGDRLTDASFASFVAKQQPASRAVAVLIGPEGGWSDGERAAARSVVRIGDHILRAETAAIAAGALLAAVRANAADVSPGG